MMRFVYIFGIAAVAAIFIVIITEIWDKYIDPYLASYSRFNRPNSIGKADIKLKYTQWLKFAAVKPEAFCVRGGCLYEVDRTREYQKKYTKIHFNVFDYYRFVFAYTRMKFNEQKAAIKHKEIKDMSEFLRRMQHNITEYQKRVGEELFECVSKSLKR